jgi:hypothetical protein
VEHLPVDVFPENNKLYTANKDGGIHWLKYHQVYFMITRAMYGTILNTMRKILNNPMKDRNATLNVSLEIENILLFIW